MGAIACYMFSLFHVFKWSFIIMTDVEFWDILANLVVKDYYIIMNEREDQIHLFMQVP